ncbi:MAG: response regulator [Pseudomonadota bacterium]
MNILVVESNMSLRRLWAWHLMRQEFDVCHVGGQDDAIAHISENNVHLIVLNLELADGDAMAVADYASYRRPEARVIFVTSNSFFSDGAIFEHCQNACALVPKATKPDDLAAMATYYSRGA